MMQIMYTHICECKNDIVETVPGWGRGDEGQQ
jgi:hypothetical protein